MEPSRADARPLTVRPMEASDLEVARGIFRRAFSAFTGVPERLLGDSDFVGFRFRRDPGTGLLVERDGAPAAAAVSAQRGTMGVVGPIMVAPEQKGGGLGSRVFGASDELLRARGARISVLYTFSHSPQHVKLFRRFGYRPRSFIGVLGWRPDPARAGRDASTRFSALSPDARSEALDAVDALCAGHLEGLSLRQDIQALATLGVGETLLGHRESALRWFAVVHHGPGTEALKGTVYVRFGLVGPGDAAAADFEQLLDAVEGYALRVGARRVSVGLLSLRRRAFEQVLARGAVLEQYGVGLATGELAEELDDERVLDDWR